MLIPFPIASIAGALAFDLVGRLGGTLACRDQVGVDHRFAGAGKWSEVAVDPSPGVPVTVAKADGLEVDRMKLTRPPDGRRLVLARTEGGDVIFDDRCTHRNGSPAVGLMACGTVTCPRHGSHPSAADGGVEAGPAGEGIATDRVEQSVGEVRLRL